MKRSVLLLIILSVAVSLNAQDESAQTYGQQNSTPSFLSRSSQKSSRSNVDKNLSGQLESKFSGRINALDQQITTLKNDIHSAYKDFSEDEFFTDKNYQLEVFEGIENEKKKLISIIKIINDSISNLKTEYQWVDDLRNFYKDSIDNLFVHADPVSLHVHKQILGHDYPKVIDDLKILLECAELMKKEYDQASNQKALRLIGKVQSCRTKDYLENLLEVHKDITEGVDNWLGEEDHSLFSIMDFYNYLNNNYGVDLTSDYPWLASKVRKSVEIGSTNKKK